MWNIGGAVALNDRHDGILVEAEVAGDEAVAEALIPKRHDAGGVPVGFRALARLAPEDFSAPQPRRWPRCPSSLQRFPAAKRFGHVGAVGTAAGTMIWASVVLVPLALVADLPWTLSPSATALAVTGVLSILCTGVALVIYFRLVETLGSMGVASGS
jgi:hypothetical protein